MTTPVGLIFKRTNLVSCFALALFLWCVPGASPVLGQRALTESEVKQSDQERLFQALLKEMRQLRLAFERTNITIFRAQILVERIRLQQGRVEGLQQQLEELRNQSSDSRLNQAQLAERFKEIESRITQERDSSLRSELEKERRELKNLIDQHSVWEERQREKENQLLAQLQIEQDRLSKLNDRLDTLERELEGPSRATEPNP